MALPPAPEDEKDGRPASGAANDGAGVPEKARPFNFRAELKRRRQESAGGTSATSDGECAQLAAERPPSVPPGEALPRTDTGSDAAPPEEGAIDVRPPAEAPAEPDLLDLPSAIRLDPQPQDTASGLQGDAVPGVRAELETEAVLGLLDTLGSRAGSLPSATAEAVQKCLGRLRDDVKAISYETALKLEADRSPSVLGQRLQRLAETLVPERTHGGGGVDTFACPEGLPQDLKASLERLPAIVRTLRQTALRLLAARLGLEVMEPQTGGPIDPSRHSVVESQHGSDPSRDNTVLREEAPGWLLGGEVLASADVIRYTCPNARGPGLPALESLGRRRLGEDLLGRKRDE